MAKVFLHIGMNKTGSSAIQSYLHHNRQVLKNAGLLWPETGRDTNDPGAGYHYRLSTALGFGVGRNEAGDADERRALRMALDAEIAASNARTVVISSEYFVLRRNPAMLAEFFDGLDTSVVVYLRRHDAWWPSLFAQAIKTTVNPPWRRSFDSYHAFHAKRQEQYFEFGPLLDDMAAIFGRDRIIACPYETGQNQPNLVAHFLDRIGVPHLADLVPPAAERVNVALSPRSLSLIDLVQRAQIEPKIRESIIRTIMDEDEGGAERALVPAPLRRRLATGQTEDYARIARDYLGRPDGVLFQDPLPEGDDGDEVGTLPFPRPVEFFAAHFTLTPHGQG